MPRQLIANTAAVATGHPLGAEAGVEILREGGNAIDAAAAAMLAMCVVVPGSVGLGGYGGSAVIHRASSREPGAGSRQPTAVAVDFDSRAPLAFCDGLVTADPHSSYYGARSVTVPAVVAGLDLVLREFGTKNWADVCRPAISLAEEGFEFDAEHQRHVERCLPKFDHQSLASLFPDGVPKLGGRWRQPDLAMLLRRLADEGPRAFYKGEIPERIVGYLQQRGGVLAAEDFDSYRPQIVESLRINFRGLDLFTPPPPSGGFTSLAIAQTVDRLLEAGSGEQGVGSIGRESSRYYHVLAEAMKLCWRERHQYLGDPDFVSIPMDELLSDRAAESRAEQIRQLSISTPRSPLSAPRSGHTANVIAIDADGNLISLTATQGWMYGSHLVVDGLGLVLNHGMSRFDYVPGHPNAPAPGKRMQHNMAPLIALRDGASAFAFGMPGGPKIVSVTAQLALNTIAFGATPVESIAVPRLHTEGGEPLSVSVQMPDAIIAVLENLGHPIRREDDMGGPVNVLAIDPQTGRINIASGESTGAVAGI